MKANSVLSQKWFPVRNVLFKCILYNSSIALRFLTETCRLGTHQSGTLDYHVTVVDIAARLCIPDRRVPDRKRPRNFSRGLVGRGRIDIAQLSTYTSILFFLLSSKHTFTRSVSISSLSVYPLSPRVSTVHDGKYVLPVISYNEVTRKYRHTHQSRSYRQGVKTTKTRHIQYSTIK